MNPENILIIKVAGIGDTLQATPFLKALKTAYPESRVSWLTTPWAEGVLRNNPLLNEIISSGIFWKKGALKRIPGAIGLAGKLRKKKFSRAYILHREPALSLLAALAGIPVITGFEKLGQKNRLTLEVAYDPSRPETERNLDLLRAEGIDCRAGELAIYLTEGERAAAKKSLAEATGLTGLPVVAVAPGGGKNPGMELFQKQWPALNFAYLLKELRGRFELDFAFFGTSEDAALIEGIRAGLGFETATFAGKTNVRELAALIERCACFVGNDSGPLFLAEALGKPTISFWGPTDPGLLAPRGERHLVFKGGADCAPCFTPDRVFDSPIRKCHDASCINSIGREAVLAGAAAFVERLGLDRFG